MQGAVAASTRIDGAEAAAQPERSRDGRARVAIENIVPGSEGDRFAVKRSVGEVVRVEADAFTDGHDLISVWLRHRFGGAPGWDEAEMVKGDNDRWAGEFEVHAVGWHEYTVVAWVDHFATWKRDLQKRIAAGQDIAIDLKVGAEWVEQTASATTDPEGARILAAFAAVLNSSQVGEATQIALGSSLQTAMKRFAVRPFPSEWPVPIRMWVDRAKARFSTWYELFPRSASPDPSRPGTLRDVRDRLDEIAGMGFDVLYLPPIHPVGRAFRKGKNNTTEARPDDVGSPWAIGGPEGGHDAIHPELGTFDDFDDLLRAAGERGIELALDLAFQCSPDHPYVKQHPQWFKHRPDGTIQYAENPPKKYQDIYPLDFECDDWTSLWNELLRVVLFWHARGVLIFRVDNPHTKPFPFWEWLIDQVRQRDPNVLFLSEAFTRPKVMYRLAKLGFTQSYTYFTWRTDPAGIRKYFTELNRSPVADFFRPNAWPNTPDILNEYLQTDARAAFVVRAVLAGTLCANYGVYGPAFELMEHRSLRQGSEEYLDSEKYQIRRWDLSRPDSLSELLGRLNQIRRAHPALQHDRSLLFHNSDNPTIVVYSKTSGKDAILVVVNTDPYHMQWANIQLDLARMDVSAEHPFQVHDLLTDARYQWNGYWAVVGLDPGSNPVHVFRVRRRARTEADFDYFV